MNHFILDNVHIITTNKEQRVLKQHYVEVKNGIIQEIAKTPIPKNKEAPVFNYQGKWILPGMYNTHGHTPMSLLRGAADDVPLNRWLEQHIWPREALLNEERVKAGTSLALLEMIKSGTVAYLDMYHLHMDRVFELVMQSGLKAVLSRGMIGFGSKRDLESKLTSACDMAKTWTDAGDSNVKGMLFPHAPYTCPPDFLKDVVEKAHQFKLPLGTHLAETKTEVIDHKKKYNKTPVSHLNELGFFDQPAILTHLVHAENDDLSLLKNKPVSISHNPMSNAKLGSGIAPIPEMLDSGLSIGLGTDSTASNNNLDMFEEMRFAALLQKANQTNPALIPAETVFDMATINGAKMLGFSEHGIMQEGAPADFIMIDSEAAHLQPETNMFSHIVYAANGQDVTDVFINGRPIMKDRELQTLDEEKIRFEANACFKDLEYEFKNTP
ncbi:amidohydrolase [Salibacterium salarium]|uniref:5-methylthioadenosine/S-adenosylhomocysteine deaminase n=1 Tax=Salibacterium salarium TaxID=284579 RepID=A0A3R9QM82_9BACI|nr:amidohydrolase [Salibacterium salarium]RSL33432.1 amidohydrolase [Salibacterium salarium]